VSNFIPIEAEGDRFYIEVLPAEGQTGIKQRSRDSLTEKLTRDDFKQMIRQAVMPACQTFVDVWQELNQPLTAESAEVEFNLGFTASGSAVIVQASGQASFKVKVSWKFDQIKKFEHEVELAEFSFSTPTREASLLKSKPKTIRLESFEELANWLPTEVGKKFLSQVNLETFKKFVGSGPPYVFPEPPVELPIEEQPIEEQPIEEQPIEEQPIEEQPIEE